MRQAYDYWQDQPGLYVTTQRYDNILREFNEINGNIDININEIDSQTINSEVNIDITMMKSNNLKIVETPGYIRQLHQMQSLPYSLSLIKLPRKPPFGNRSVLRHHSHREFRPHKCRQ